MAHTDVKSSVNPSRSGLQRIYSDGLHKWGPPHSRQPSKLLELVTGLPHAECWQDANNSKDFLLNSLLQQVAKVFIGPAHHIEFFPRPRTREEPQCTAIVKNGVCIWIEALRNLSVDAAKMATIHVASGQIVYKDWNYTSIWDLSHASVELLSSLTRVDFGEVPTTMLREEPNQSHNALHILAQERAETGTIRLVYGLDEKRFERTLQPGIITEELLMATAQVACPRGATCHDELTLPCWQRKSGWDCANLLGDRSSHIPSGESYSVGFMWHASSLLSKLLAIEGCRMMAWYNSAHFNNSAILIHSDQCMACMTRYVSTFRDRASWEHSLYYRDKRRVLVEKNDLRCSIHII